MHRPPFAALAAAAVATLLAIPGCLDDVLGEDRSDWAYAATQLDALADLGRTGKGVTIAILDTGINLQHPALDHLADGDRENGEVVAFRDFLGTADEVPEAFDDDGHGSHVAGIIAARGGSSGLGGFDLRGGAPNALLVVARVCAGQDCPSATIDDAVRWAVNEQGADVISMSLGGAPGFAIGPLSSDPAVAAVDAAIDRGVVVLASAGNGGPCAPEERRTTDVQSPGSIPGVIAVGAHDRDGRVACFSSQGDDAGNPCRPIVLPLPGIASRCPPDQKPEIVAPGVGILSAWTGSQYATADGTSQAAPFAAAAVALLLEGRNLSSRADVEAVKQALVDSAASVPGQIEPHDPAAGYGRLQARGALREYLGQ